MYTIELEFAAEVESEFLDFVKESLPLVSVKETDRFHPRSVTITFQSASKLVLEELVIEYCNQDPRQYIDMFSQIKESQ